MRPEPVASPGKRRAITNKDPLGTNKMETMQKEPVRLGFLNAFKPDGKKQLKGISLKAEWAHNYAFTLMNTEISYNFLYAEAMEKINHENLILH